MWHLAKYSPFLPSLKGAFLPSILNYYVSIGWNEIIPDAAFLQALLVRNEILLIPVSMKWDGLYALINGTRTIFLRDDLTEPYRSFVLIHELAHTWLHSAQVCFCYPQARPTISEAQAMVLATCTLLPRPRLERSSPLEIQHTLHYPADLIDFRREILTHCEF